MTPGSSMEFLAGWDFTKIKHRTAAWKQVKTEDPYVIVGSPPCTMASLFQELSIANNQPKEGWMEEFERKKAEAINHIIFCCLLYK